MKAFPKGRTAFLSSLNPGPSEPDRSTTLLLTDPGTAAHIRDRLAKQLNPCSEPVVLVLDLAGMEFTPAALQELILPLAQRIRGGEHGVVRLVVSTTDPAVGDFIRYMAHVHELPLYLSYSPFELGESTPIGALTATGKDTLDTIRALGGQVTASRLAEEEGIKPSAAANRLASLDREGYLVRQQRGRRDGDLYIQPPSATTTPMIFDDAFEFSTSGTGLGRSVRSTASG